MSVTPDTDTLHEHVAFDPRDPTQKPRDPKTWKKTRNPALILATVAMELAGQALVLDFDLLIAQANYCEELIDARMG